MGTFSWTNIPFNNGHVPVTLERIVRALVGRLLRDHNQQQIADLFGADRTQISKYVSGTTNEKRTITLDYLEHYASKLPGGARALVAALNQIAAGMPDDALTEDETFKGKERRGRKSNAAKAALASVPLLALPPKQAAQKEQALAKIAKVVTGEKAPRAKKAPVKSERPRPEKERPGSGR